jgi:hypothetical protein
VLAEKAGKEERLKTRTRPMRDFLIAKRIGESDLKQKRID